MEIQISSSFSFLTYKVVDLKYKTNNVFGIIHFLLSIGYSLVNKVVDLKYKTNNVFGIIHFLLSIGFSLLNKVQLHRAWTGFHFFTNLLLCYFFKICLFPENILYRKSEICKSLRPLKIIKLI